MAKKDRPLSEAERGEIEDCVIGALQWFGTRADAESPDQLQERLYEAINDFRSQPKKARKAHITEVALCLGGLWGQTVCDQLGWEWAAVSLEPDDERYGIVRRSRSHVIFPFHYVHDLLGDPESDQTSLLLYNMLKGGSLPKAKRREYMVIG